MRQYITCVTVIPQEALISRVSFLPSVSFTEKIDCIYFIALGLSKSLGLFPVKQNTNIKKQDNLVLVFIDRYQRSLVETPKANKTTNNHK